MHSRRQIHLSESKDIHEKENTDDSLINLTRETVGTASSPESSNSQSSSKQSSPGDSGASSAPELEDLMQRTHI